jgi:radical SAM protein with 4Fe4S-binding SPASM domain
MNETSFDTLLQKIRRYRIPFNTVFEVTEKCNLSCVHCYQKRGENELNFQEITSILGQLKEAGCLKITLTGGEPTLRKDFEDIYRDAHEKGFAITLYTNGTLLGEQTLRLLADSPPLAVECSLYGATAETHDGITGKRGSFDATLETLRRMKGMGIPVVVKTVVMTMNLEELGLMKDLTKDLGVVFQPTLRIFTSADPQRSVSHLRVSSEDIRNSVSEKYSDPPLRDRDEHRKEEEFLCHAGRDACCIGADGEVYPCTALRLKCGNLRKQSFQEIWQGSPRLEEWRSVTDSDYPLCARCTWKEKCQFCPGMGFMEHGDPLVPSKELCRITEAMWS